MNGKPLPMDSAEMIAMAAYLRVARRRSTSAMGASLRKAEEPPPFKTPTRAADLERGAGRLRRAMRAVPRRPTALGLLATTDQAQGVSLPAAVGTRSFNDGAGMHRVLTAARFIKARMPLGEPTLTDDEAFDVAAYHQQPAAAGDGEPRARLSGQDRQAGGQSLRALTPTTSREEQHKFGPFQPIEEHYKALKKAK